jgi:two-component system, chemotaxis family, chemotaxis protein CheY
VPALLIVSFDTEAISQVELRAQSLNYNVRSLTTTKSAKEWLAMRSFDALLVDTRFERNEGIELIQLAWKLHPLMFCGIFNLLGDEITGEKSAKIIGAQTFKYPNALDDITNALSNIPKSVIIDKFQILLVDDLNAPRDIIGSYIEMLGYSQVCGSESVKEAIYLLSQDPTAFSCVITDINMPNQSGIALIEHIRSNKELQHIPVIVLTAYSTTDNLIECVKAGATGFLVKPPGKKSLREEIEKAKRIFLRHDSPRICEPEEAEQLRDELTAKYKTVI